MKAKNVIILIVAVLAIVIIFYSIQDTGDDSAYITQIEKERQERDRFMRTSSESPFAENPAEFKGLKYYPPDVSYRIIANLRPIQQKKPVLLTTNDGKEQRYIEYAWAEFKLFGQEHRLLILEIADMGPFRGKLFLAFGDETSANETYGGGRYLDVAAPPGSSTIKLDFNLAYNPYCAYNDAFSCPLPPRENILGISIKAGEKGYE
jgi:uncharacterized protein (DUF1684 family)